MVCAIMLLNISLYYIYIGIYVLKKKKKMNHELKMKYVTSIFLDNFSTREENES